MQADAGNVNQVLGQVTQKIKTLNQGSPSGGGVTPIPASVPASYEKAAGGIKQIAAGFAVAQGAIIAVTAALHAVANAASGFIEINSQMEQLRMQYKVLIGDVEKANIIFAETKKFADTTPFNDMETYSAGRALLAAQIKDLNEYKAALKTVADLAAASGRPINEVAGAYARLKSGATGEAMEALRLMNISRTMFEAKGVRFDASGQALATSKELVGVLNEIVSSNFGGLTQEISTKWAGLWSTFTSNAQNAARDVSSGAFGQLEAALDSANKSLDVLLKDPEQRFKRLGDGVSSLTGAIGQASSAFGGLFGKSALSAMEVIGGGMAAASLAISTFAYLAKQAGIATQFLWDVMSLSGNARENFVSGMREATNGYNTQLTLIKGALGMQSKAAQEAASSETDGIKKVTRERNDAAMAAVENSKQVIANIKVIMASQESLWAVEKAKGRDASQLAQMEMEQRKLNLQVLQETEEKERSAAEANGGRYQKSQAMLEAETKYAQSIEKYYDALISKQETLGEFITKTTKLLAEADAIDKRGGDSGVKRYEALKTAVDEYLDGLKKMRDAQAQTATNSAKMMEAAKAAQTGNLTQYQNMGAVIDQGEKMFQISALQERLAQIQQLSQAQNLGARERFSLYEQERSVFAELTGSIGSAIESTMQKIQSMQSAALGAASSAIGIMEKVGATRSDYAAIASMVSSLRLDPGNMSLQNLGQMANIADQLKKKKINVRDIMPSPGEVLSALQRELSGVPETISKLQSGLQTLVGLSAQVGLQAADNFWKPWEEKLETLRTQIGSLANSNLNPLQYAPPPVPIPETNASRNENKTVNVNTQTSLNIQGSTLKDVEGIVTQAKERFGEELYAALQQANSQFGFS